MNIKITSLIKFYSLTILLFQFSLIAKGQQTILFSDNFSNNHNNWILNGKKILISKETGYLIDNTSKQDFISLQTIPINSNKDFEIVLKIKAEWMDDDKYSIGEFGAGFRACGVFIGAKDENNGFSVAVTTNHVLKISKWVNGKEESLAYNQKAIEESLFQETKIKIVGENNRWKVLNNFDIEIANIAAQTFMGDKAGVYVQAKQKWQFHSLEIYENEKKSTIVNHEFPADKFIQRLSEIVCEAKDKFSNVLGEERSTPDFYNYKNTVPGFVNVFIKKNSDEIKLDEIGKGKVAELIAVSVKIENMDDAMSYFDIIKNSINKSKSDCNIPPEDNTDLAKKHFHFEDNPKSQLWANISYNPIALILIITLNGGTDGITKKYYEVEFHCIVTY